MKKTLLLLLSFLVIMNVIPAQEIKKENKYFSSEISIGIVEGEQGTNFHVELLNGLRYKTWFAGIGTGLDYYYYRTIPVYLSGIKYLSPRNHSFFIQGDAGINFAWIEGRMNVWNEINHEFKQIGRAHV